MVALPKRSFFDSYGVFNSYVFKKGGIMEERIKKLEGFILELLSSKDINVFVQIEYFAKLDLLLKDYNGDLQ